MNKRMGWKSVVGITALVVGCGIGAIQSNRMHGADVSGTEAKASRGASFDWTKGTRYVYDVDLSMEQTLTIPGIALSAKDAPEANTLTLRGELLLSSYGLDNGAYVLGVSFRNIEQHGFRLLGSDVLATSKSVDDTFKNQEAIVQIRPNGTVDATYFQHRAPALFRAVTRAALGLAQVSLSAQPGGAAPEAWSALEAAPLGLAQSNYALDNGNSLRLIRDRASYTTVDALTGLSTSLSTQELHAHGEIMLDGHGHVARIDDEETAAFNANEAKSAQLRAKSAFHMAAKGTEPFAADGSLDVASLEVVHRGDAPQPVIDEHAELEQLSAGVELNAVEAFIAGYSGGSLENGFMQRVSAYLKLRPEACLDLLDLFRQPEARDTSRLLILDLLAAAGHGPAQSALRTALDSPAATANGVMFTRMIQRFTFVSKPDAESVAFLEKTLATAKATGDANVRYGATYAMGSVAAHLANAGDTAGARAQVSRLKSELAAAKTPDDKSANLIALGSSHSPDARGAIRAFATDDDASVRSSAAYALNGAEDPDSRKALLGLAFDGDKDVVEAALGSLSGVRASESELARLEGLTSDGPHAAGTSAMLVDFLGKQAEAGADVRPMLEAMLPRVENDGMLHARVAQILAFLKERS